MSRLALVRDLRFKEHSTPALHPESPRRLEAIDKAFATSALQEKCSEISQDYIFEEIGSVTVKGKEKPTTIFKVNGYYENGSPVIIETPYSSYPAS